MQVEIDQNSGFCGGVIRAIGTAERILEGGDRLYSLGAIVHNEEELNRLEARGLVTIDTDDLGRPISRANQVARCGNAVCPPLSKAMVLANMPEFCDGGR